MEFYDEDGEEIRDGIDRLERLETEIRRGLGDYIGNSLEHLASDVRGSDRWLIDRYLPTGLSMLYGPSGSFKSFIALDMAASVATGLPWLGEYSTEAQDVLYINTDTAPIKKRLLAWLLHKGIERHPARFVPFERPINFRDSEIIPRLIPTLKKEFKRRAKDMKSYDLAASRDFDELARNFDPRLVVVDTVDKAFRGSWSSDDDVREFLFGVQRLFRDSDASVLLIHHTGKDADRGPLGSEAFRTSPNAVYSIKRKEEFVDIVANKAPRDEAPPAPLRLRSKVVPIPERLVPTKDISDLESVGVPRDDALSSLVLTQSGEALGAPKPGVTNASRVLSAFNNAPGSEMSRADLLALTKLPPSTLDKELKRATTAGLLVPTSRGIYRIAQAIKAVA